MGAQVGGGGGLANVKLVACKGAKGGWFGLGRWWWWFRWGLCSEGGC